MANTHMPIDGRLGVKLGETHATAQHRLGDVVKGNNGSEWMYVQAPAADTIAQYDCVAIQASATAAPVTHALARAGNTIGIAQVAFATADYGWVAINGHALTVNLAGAEAVGVTLYTTDTPGKLADATASGSAATIFGLTLVATASGATASNAACIMQNAVVRKTIADS
ncbi:MAG: hypothetical protein IT536_13885 [Hyphomicrobiales bacterium]|nr:hypothetical protein [Hyphomicrobiales bacterium]